MKKLLFLFIILSNIVYSQSKKVSQAEIDSATLNFLKIKELDSFKKVLNANKILNGWIYYYRRKGYLKYLEGEYDSVIYYEENAIKSFQNLDIKRNFDEKKLITAYYFLGLALIEKKQYAIALVNFEKSLNLCEDYPYKWKSFIIKALGDCHNALGDRRTALSYYKLSLKDSLYSSLPGPKISTMMRMGMTYFDEFNNSDSAKYYLKKSLKKSLNSDYKKNITAIHSNLGHIYESENKVDSAVYHYELQKVAYEKFKPTYTYANLFVLVNDSYVQIQKGNYTKSFENLNVVYDSIKKVEKLTRNDKDLYITVLDYFILYYVKTNNIRKALEKSEEKAKISEVFLEQFLKEKINDLEIQFKSKQKDKSILQLEKNKLQQETIIKQQKAITYSLGGLLLVIIGFGYLFWRQRKLKTQYEKVNLEQRLLRSQMNPHFIFNALNVINSLASKKSKKTNSYILKFSSLLRLILNNSREEFVSLKDEVTALENYLILQSDFNTKFNFNIQIDESLDENEIYIPPMLIQPFVENSIGHGLNSIEKGELKIRLTPVENQKLIECIIEDNGIGYSQSLENKKHTNYLHKSVSGSIVKERLKLYKKKFKVNSNFTIENRLDISQNSIGTTVVVTIPYFQD